MVFSFENTQSREEGGGRSYKRGLREGDLRDIVTRE